MPYSGLKPWHGRAEGAGSVKSKALGKTNKNQTTLWQGSNKQAKERWDKEPFSPLRAQDLNPAQIRGI